MEVKLSRRFGSGDARQTDLTAAPQIERDFNHQDLLESMHDLIGC
jgi:hypothetical protein